MKSLQFIKANFQVIDIHEHKFNPINEIINGLNKPENVQKTIPTFLLYDNKGLQSPNKTKLILDSLEKKKKNITYYALGLVEYQLGKFLDSLGKYENIKLMGLSGTYEDGINFVSSLGELSKTILWLGSSIGNFSREDGANFIQRFQNRSMNPGDLFLIGIDRKNDPDKIELAYNDPKGDTKEFILNGLNHVNAVLGQENFIDLDDFEYHSLYNESEGRHEAYYKSKKDITLKYTPNEGAEEKGINLKKDELIHIEYSYKYDKNNLIQLFHNAKLSHVESWSDFQSQYDLHLLSKPPFYFSRGGGDSSQESIPTLDEWEELWRSWDTVTMTMISPKRLLEKPIHLRHPFIFYLGHIPGFLDIHLSRYHKEKHTEPEYFADIFERGIDPDIDDPSKCHSHSITPDKWPELDKIMEYCDKVKERLISVYEKKTMKRSLGRILFMTFEHTALHLETILYMLVQSPFTLQPKGVVIPKWKEAVVPASDAKFITIPKQTITSPRREVSIESFKIHSRPVTNGEYLSFMRATVNKEYPGSWIPIDPPSFEYEVRTVFGAVKMNVALNWPVMLSQDQACKYAAWKKMRLPTEGELNSFYKIYKSSSLLMDLSNIGFKNWHPVDVPNDSNTIQVLGSGWEWTSSEFDKYPGFKQSKLYPGYSADFFDGKHVVVLGGSWATHPRLTRSTFRNWYQRGYPYVFCTVRLCQI
ncbi:424_t:CDS:2 [Entrophospora sp. SA101]|nr:424_t:CDS:2 [Entrophospora sp. SA101]CAJ0900966.1 2567_t:CDS:2 [Entrophospora sp. SA101]